MKLTLTSIACFVMLSASPLLAQESSIPKNQLSLEDLTQFQPASSNWTTVQELFIPLMGDKIDSKKGGGILLSSPQKSAGQPLVTNMEHGDVELILDYMVSEKSSANIYFQGRYGLQISDSWANQAPNFRAAGAIDQRWDDSRAEGRKGFQGHAPLLSVSRAPGLWQSLRVNFRAPRFDAQGNKTENAKFVSVYLNDVLVQNNIELTGPTQEALDNDEAATGPLVFNSNNGVLAIRNVLYKSFGAEKVTLDAMKLSSYDSIKSMKDFTSASPKGEMDIDVLAHLAPSSNNEFAGVIEGILTVPHTETYFFDLNFSWIPAERLQGVVNGEGTLLIDGAEVIKLEDGHDRLSNSIQLSAGAHKFKLIYYKSFNLWYARQNNITLKVEAEGVEQTSLNSPLRETDFAGKIEVKVSNEAQTQRGFLIYEDEKRTHTMAVGEPSGVNYVIDLSKGELLSVWRGKFVDTTPMWYGRGETQLMIPMGDVIELGGKPTVAILSDKDAAWEMEDPSFSYEGYSMKKNGEPIIHYTLGGKEINETFEVADGGKKLTHIIQTNPVDQPENAWVMVASGSSIEKLPNGLYAVADKSYYIELMGKESPLIRQAKDGTTEMLLPVNGKGSSGLVKYSLVW